MRVEVQIATFGLFFIYGFIHGLLDTFFYKKHKVCNYAMATILTGLFMFVLVQVNGGIVHPYFLIVFLVGIFVSKVSVKYVKKTCTLLKAKRKR